jgi:hypothetical protein
MRKEASMLEAFVLNPPRRKKARRSKGRGKRRPMTALQLKYFGKGRKRKASRRSSKRRRNIWGNDAAGHRKAAKKGWRKRKTRASKRRKNVRRRNPAAAKYGINPRKRRSSSRRRNAGGVTYGINPSSGGILGMRLPAILPIRLPGFLGKGLPGTIINNVLQGALAGTVVFAGYYGSGQLVEAVEPKLPEQLKGKFTRPVMYGIIAGVLGGAVAMLPIKDGKRKALWAVLVASGAGMRAFGGFLQALIPATSTGVVGQIRTAAGNLADYIQVGEEAHEAGLGEEAYEAGMSDYIQVGEEAYEAGMSNDVEEELSVE